MMPRDETTRNPLLRALHASGRRLVSFVLPPVCVVCEDIVHTHEPVGVCPVCWQDLPFWHDLDEPAPDTGRHIRRFDAPFLYRPPLPGLVHAFKFMDTYELARPLAVFMAQKIKDDQVDVVVPVPLHTRRLRWRAYNQAAVLAKHLSRLRQIPYDFDALKRVRYTTSQMGQSAAKRRKNLKNAFVADKAVVENKRILLIDDVWTTGSTARECAKALKAAGATHVDVLTLAYVPFGEGANVS